MSLKAKCLAVLTALLFSSLPPSAMAELSPPFSEKFDTVPADFKDIPATTANQHLTIKPPAGTTCAANLQLETLRRLRIKCHFGHSFIA